MRNDSPRTPPAGRRPPPLSFAFVVLLILAVGPNTFAQDPAPPFSAFFTEPERHELTIRMDMPSREALPAYRADVLRFFSMASAVPQAPLGLDQDDDFNAPGTEQAAADNGRVQVVLGTDNPFYDFQRPGSPGGAGFYRFYSQALLFDTRRTAFSVGFDATTPAGLESDGIATGPTYLSPNLAWLYDMGRGNVFNAFVGQNLRARTHWSNGLTRTTRYGLAWQSRCPGVACNADHGLHFFVEALGRFRYDGTTPQSASRNWEFIPGVQWRLSPNWWLTGGYLVPLGASNAENRVQLNCVLRF
jgi:hypothetical protein